LAPVCAKCQTELPTGAKFCLECGEPVAGQPASTSRFTTPETYTPKHLADKILTSKSALEGERKQVTVLFADLKSSMELLAERDPEEARKLLDPVLERMMEAVHRYEGTVNQVMGDGIMALFGAPLAHEDHAVRACYAALRLQASVQRYAEDLRRKQGVTVRVRVGVNSGEVVVRAIGNDLHMDYTAVGQTTHLAARMEQLAEPGTTHLTSATLTLAEDFVQVRALGPTPVKGVREPIAVYELVSANPVRSRFQAHAARGLTKFVGRATEVAQLAEALDIARAGRGQVVAVVGEAGVGKSRLFWEFAHTHRMGGDLVIATASVSYGKATAYLPVIELLRDYFEIQPRDDLRKVRERVTGKLLSLDRTLEPTLPALLALLDVPVEDQLWSRLDLPQRRQRTLEAVKHLLLRESHVQPLVVIFEDLHWIDGETQAVLDGLVESLPKARILLLVNYRAEYQHPWSSKRYYRQVQLDTLLIACADELLEALLGPDDSLGPLKRFLIERTEGNPFFLEESVRTLVETDALEGAPGKYRLTRAPASLQMPTMVQGIVAARVDRLDPEDKRLLQAASVIGKDVSLELLEAITDLPESALRESLGRLQSAEFLYETRLFPEVEYTFAHVLTHEVTYGGLLQERRLELHGRIVDSMEALHLERLDEQIEKLAMHAARGDLREKALHYLRQAGLKSAARSAAQDARAWFEQALDVLPRLPESRSTLEQAFDIRLEMRQVLVQLGEFRTSLQMMREALGLAERLNDDHRLARVYTFMMGDHTMLGQLDEARVIGIRAASMANALGDLRLRILTTTYLARVHFVIGEYNRAVELATGNLAALPSEWADEYFGMASPASIFDRMWLVLSLAHVGKFAEARGHGAEAIQLAEATHRLHPIYLAYHAAATPHLLRGDWEKARQLIETAIRNEGAGVTGAIHVTHFALSAWILAQLGEASEALYRLREGELRLERLQAKGTHVYSAWDYHALGRAYLLLDRLDNARRVANRAIEFSSSQPGFAAYALHLIGAIATHPDAFDPKSGEAYYRRALALSEPLGMRPLVAHCHLGLGTLCRCTGHAAQAREHLAGAAKMYSQMSMPFWLQKAEAEERLLH
jgi:class 3 adenylate cyclase/tetratricopeptide (TPR) repeat protein